MKEPSTASRLLESKAAFARRLGVARSTVTRDAAAGRLVLVDDQVDVKASLARRTATRGGREDVAQRHAAARAAANPARGDENMAPEGLAPFGDLQEQPLPESGCAQTSEDGRAHFKALLVHYENMQIKLAIASARGLRFQRRAVAREAAALGAMLRSYIELIIDQTAPRLAVVTDPAERRRLLRIEVARVRREIRAEFPRSLRRLRNAGDKS